MLLFSNPPLTGKRGRPRALECKRGHPRVPTERACVACRRYRERLKYETDSGVKEKKLAYQRNYRAAFLAKHGYGVHCL